jgi:hypothetical protein
VKACWRAHVQTITGVEFIESSKVVISSALDCTIRIWSIHGEYIGTFGQEDIWNLYDPKTYKHPLVPFDILIDENSLPQHPIFNKRETFQEVLEANKIIEKQQKDQEVSYYVLYFFSFISLHQGSFELRYNKKY